MNAMNAWPFRVSIHLCTFVPESHLIDFRKQWSQFNGINISGEASLTTRTFVFICTTDYCENCFIRFFSIFSLQLYVTVMYKCCIFFLLWQHKSVKRMWNESMWCFWHYDTQYKDLPTFVTFQCNTDSKTAQTFPIYEEVKYV